MFNMRSYLGFCSSTYFITMLKPRLIFLSVVFSAFFSLFFSCHCSQFPLDSKLLVSETHYWTSPNGDFAFGFFNQSDQQGMFKAGIRFNFDSVPVQNQVVVWVAGADASVNWDSFIHLTPEGDLVLFDSARNVAIWTSNTSHLSVSSASLLDDGNLVLVNDKQLIVWQSFQTPSDTLLPGQNLSTVQNLRAASKNSTSSYYSLSFDGSGQLKLSWESNVTYWTSDTASAATDAVVYSKDGSLQLLDQRHKPVWSIYGDDHGDSAITYRFLRLDVDGNLRMYSWLGASTSWRTVWQAVENQCHVFATCGLHGVCTFVSASKTECKCTFGVSGAPTSMCSAKIRGSCGPELIMRELKHTFLYGIYPPKDIISKASLEQCKKSCIQDPLCTAVTIPNDGSGECWTKRTGYVTGYENPSIAAISFVKDCLEPFAVNPDKFPAKPQNSVPPIKKRHSLPWLYLIGGAAGAFLVFLVLQIVIGFLFFRRKFSLFRNVHVAYAGPCSRGLNSFSYGEIHDLTENFSNQLGPTIYKCVLPNQLSVVVKAIKQVNDEMIIEEKSFKSAVSLLGSIHHKNLMKLEGYCCEGVYRFLIYGHLKNGSVSRWILDPKLSRKLSWRMRIDICVGVAKAISYLHMGCREFITHGNLKWENIILDEEMSPKVTEFGLNRMVAGWISNHDGAAEEDVAMYGQMVVTMITGRLNDADILKWAYEEWSKGQAENILDVRIEGGHPPEELDRSLRIAFWCFQADEQLRPAMSEVVKVLEGTLRVDPPPLPFARPRLSAELVSSSAISEIETDEA